LSIFYDFSLNHHTNKNCHYINVWLLEPRRTLTLKGPRVLAKLTAKGVEEYERLVDDLKNFVLKVKTGTSQ